MIKLGYTIPLIFMFLISGCGAYTLPVNYAPPLEGQVVSIAPSTVMYGIRAVLQGLPGTAILGNGNRFLFIWSYSNGAAAFWGFDATVEQFNVAEVIRAGGNLANCRTVSDLVVSLQGKGWTTVAPTTIPAAVVAIAGNRLVVAPVIMFTVGVFGENGSFEEWFENTFAPEEVQG